MIAMRDNITAVMIVKNEEANLERCLESVKDFMPVVIVDTGSKDRTMEIAQNYGAELHEHRWQDSFSEARNHALQYVKTPWALQVDADEEVAEATVSELDKLDPERDVYMTPIHNITQDRSMSLHHFERIYKPDKVHYKWRVHNELQYDQEAGITGLSFLHHGYSLSDEEMQKKYKNTLRLLMLDIEDAGYVTRNVRYLIQTYRALQRHADVLDVMQNHIHKLREVPGIYQEAAAAAIVAHNALGDNAKAKVAGIKLLDEFPEALDALFYMSVLSIEDQAWDIAMHYTTKYIKVRSALQLQGCNSTIAYHAWGNRADAFQNIGICASMLGNKAQAALLFMRAEMLADHRTDIAGFAANTDNAMCLLVDEEPAESKSAGKIMKLTMPDEDMGKKGTAAIQIPAIKGSGVVITKD